MDTVILKVTLKTTRTVRSIRLTNAVYRALEHAMEADIEGAELLNSDLVSAFSVVETLHA